MAPPGRASYEWHVIHAALPLGEVLSDANDLDRQFEAKGLVYHDPKADAWLTAIGGRLAPPAPERVTYKFRFLRDAMVNAFALPNGSIYVNTGLVAAMRNESELAAVLSHEITHVIDRHSYLQNRSTRKKTVAIDVIAAAGSVGGAFPFGAAIAASAQASQVFIIASVYGYSREPLALQHRATGCLLA